MSSNEILTNPIYGKGSRGSNNCFHCGKAFGNERKGPMARNYSKRKAITESTITKLTRLLPTYSLDRSVHRIIAMATAQAHGSALTKERW